VSDPDQRSHNGNGRRRLDSPDDYVVRELATALGRKVQVIPLLVGGARMPAATTLPSVLAELTHRNAMEVSDARFADDAERLCQVIAQALGLRQDEKQARERREYGRFIPDAEMASADRRFGRVVWLSFGLMLLGTLQATLSQLLPPAAAVDPAVKQPMGFNCDDPSIKLDNEKYVVCRVINYVMGGSGEIASWMNVASLVLTVLFYLFLAFVIMRLLQGKRWARVVYTLTGGILALAAFELLTTGPLQGALHAASALFLCGAVVSFGWAIRKAFTDPIRRRFGRS
jgi:hypothetical protein